MMKTNFRKKITGVICLALAGAVLLTGCTSPFGKGKTDSDNSSVSDSKDKSDASTISQKVDVNCIYHESVNFKLEDDMEVNANIFAFNGDTGYTIAYKYDDEKFSNSVDLVKLNMNDGSIINIIPLDMENGYISGNIAVDDEENIYMLKCEYPEYNDIIEDDVVEETAEGEEDNADDESSDDDLVGEDVQIMPRAAAADSVAEDIAAPEEDVIADDDVISDGEDDYYNEYEEKFYFMKLDKDGNVLVEKLLDELSEQMENFYVQDMCFANGKFYLLCDSTIAVLDNEGKLLNTVSSENDNISWFNNMIKTKDEKILVSYYDGQDNKQRLCEIDEAENKLGKDYLVENSERYNMIAGSGEYDLFMYNSTEMCGYKLETNEMVKLVDWVDSDLNGSNLNRCVSLGENKFIISYYDQLDGKSVLTVIEKTKAEDVKEKEVITLAGIYVDGQVLAQITKYNKSNDNYRIKVTDYSQYNTDDEDGWKVGMKKFNADMAIGNVADIIILSNSAMPVEILASKGILADLNPLLDKSATVKREDLMENVLTASSVDGKLYSIPAAFNINTLAAKTSHLNGKTSMTVTEFIELADSLDDDTTILRKDYMLREPLLDTLLVGAASSFINYSEKSCSFDSEEFVKILEFVNKYPSSEEFYAEFEENGDEAWNQMYNEMEASYRKDKAIFDRVYIWDAQSMWQTEKGKFGDDITYIGYPSSDPSGTTMNCSLEFGIYSKSDNQEAAWEFISEFLGKEFQENSWNGMSIRNDVFENSFENAMKPYTYEDENGNTVEEKNYYYIGDEEIEIGYMDEEHKNKYMDFIRSVKKKNTFPEEIYSIISEETEALFSGQKSAREVADLIQNRATTYINETM